jgi:hypothetical protein
MNPRELSKSGHLIRAGVMGSLILTMLQSSVLGAAASNQDDESWISLFNVQIAVDWWSQKFSEFSFQTGHNYAGQHVSGGEFTGNGEAGFDAPATSVADQVAKDHDWLLRFVDDPFLRPFIDLYAVVGGLGAAVLSVTERTPKGAESEAIFALSMSEGLIFRTAISSWEARTALLYSSGFKWRPADGGGLLWRPADGGGLPWHPADGGGVNLAGPE